jgi:hypothetical protein
VGGDQAHASIREISKRTGLHRNSRPLAVSKLDPLKEWICEQLRADPRIQSLRLREMAAEHGLRVNVRDDGMGFVPRADSPGLSLGLPMIATLTSSMAIQDTPSGGTEVCMGFSR